MNRLMDLLKLRRKDHRPPFGIADLMKYIGPGLLVTVGFIDPGNWASNMAAGAAVRLYAFVDGHALHDHAHRPAAQRGPSRHRYRPVPVRGGDATCGRNGYAALYWAVRAAAISTALAEILGAVIALNMLFHLPIQVGALLTLAVVLVILFTNSYRKIEKMIIGFVSLIGLSFMFEMYLVTYDWAAAARLGIPAFPHGSMVVIMSVLGAVVMPHNLFLHSEIIQSRQWNLAGRSRNQEAAQVRVYRHAAVHDRRVGNATPRMIMMAAAHFLYAGIPS